MKKNISIILLMIIFWASGCSKSSGPFSQIQQLDTVDTTLVNSALLDTSSWNWNSCYFHYVPAPGSAYPAIWNIDLSGSGTFSFPTNSQMMMDDIDVTPIASGGSPTFYRATYVYIVNKNTLYLTDAATGLIHDTLYIRIELNELDVQFRKTFPDGSYELWNRTGFRQ